LNNVRARRFRQLEEKQKLMEAERARKREETRKAKEEQEKVLGKGGARPKLSFSLA
jgi:hypothetical protein